MPPRKGKTLQRRRRDVVCPTGKVGFFPAEKLGLLPGQPTPQLQVLSVCGAMVPLRDQAWAEVKTRAIGSVSAPA